MPVTVGGSPITAPQAAQILDAIGAIPEDAAWGVHPTVAANYQVIVDCMWGALQP